MQLLCNRRDSSRHELTIFSGDDAGASALASFSCFSSFLDHEMDLRSVFAHKNAGARLDARELEWSPAIVTDDGDRDAFRATLSVAQDDGRGAQPIMRARGGHSLKDSSRSGN